MEVAYILILNYSLQGGNCNLKLCMVGSVNKELKDKMVTELSIGIFSFSKKKKYRNIKKLKKEYEYSSRFHSFCCPIIAFGMARSVEYSTWPLLLAWPLSSLNPTATPNSCLHQFFKTQDPPTPSYDHSLCQEASTTKRVFGWGENKNDEK